ncbi:hypothetical protein R1flu_024248 [Riccia fluitans]|uniref:Plant heme peroxidase family profile domain-containing protein n=1 Tax=Riccia fluitans TaxID=41844 RepID=A0ABD1XX92_9MARC
MWGNCITATTIWNNLQHRGMAHSTPVLPAHGVSDREGNGGGVETSTRTGCDGSILLESSHYSPAEKESRVPDSPMEIAYDIIDEIKGAIEKVCPVTASCAEILTLTARDSIVELGGSGWEMCSGPLDGFISYANEVKFYMPGTRADYRTFVKKFAVKGLTEMDMVVLSDMPHSQTDSIHAFSRFFENKVVCCSTI